MLTARGWWFLVLAIIPCVLGIFLAERIGPGMAIIGLVLLTWFLWEWARFAFATYALVPSLIARREVRDERKAVPVLWAGGAFDVEVHVALGRAGDLPYVVVADWVPREATLVRGSAQVTTALRSASGVTLSYRLEAPMPGELRFEGVRVQVADRQGFFYHRTLLREGAVFPVLPRLTGAEGQRRGLKRINIFPPPGVHRMKRPGGGSELLDLRDYIPGDPPKMIAWKPSARRDRLITKEFESEVPLRCTLFVDASEGTRLGAKRNKITRLANLAAGVAEAAVADRDHAGLVVFDEYATEVMRPKRSRRHVIDMLTMLAKAAARPNAVGPYADPALLTRLAYPLANEMYPELMSRRVNTVPLRMFWNPIADTRRGWIVLILWLPLLFHIFNWGARQIAYGQEWSQTYAESIEVSEFLAQKSHALIEWKFDESEEYSIDTPGEPIVLLKTWFWSAIVAGLGVLFWLFHGISGFFDPSRSDRLRRKQLALLFTTLDGDAPGAEAHYLHDDPMFARRAQKFLTEHHGRFPIRLYDTKGRYLFHGRPKLDVLAKAINNSVARGRDNELFVLLVDLVDLADDLDALLPTVRVAIARHHQVLVIVPWQADIPAPPAEAPSEDEVSLRKAERFSAGGYKAVANEVERELVDRYHRGYFRLRKAFGRLGVQVIRADNGEPVQLVLDRLDRMRLVGRGR